MLRVEHLQARYGRSQILQDVSLHSGASEVVCLLGRNGAGKSTTLKCLMGLLVPNAGAVSLDGAAITGLPAYAIARRGIGYVPEERLIFPKLTVAENLSMGIWHDRSQVPASIDRVLGYFPRLKEKLRARGNTLSGGEQQMLSIGRALMAEPRVLLVDEPTEGLAPVIVQALERTLLALAASGTSVLVVESKLAVASRIAARIYVMAKGKTVFHGKPDDLQDNHEIRREFLEV
ncbi:MULTISPECIES: ABC transporter ATP-binding protein [unclassified Acidisoma]|jgi:branched-chain amino acid transport system ATP-binding protein|uniref:ABC transporter ATP-binding protein n=1 Tax=unclassified Acidisoma TaxID=2634065 RepID=UPI00131E0823|nr:MULTISPECIES: ABC transporter ATP-binding protein [unclassified Acidisoma]